MSGEERAKKRDRKSPVPLESAILLAAAYGLFGKVEQRYIVQQLKSTQPKELPNLDHPKLERNDYKYLEKIP
ncbi:hypothetical protein MNQ98_05295 [Paenibacillus sp. N3/727]|uniref:hypothetical protein n=1 Tax=Paenibacillus sp. N3/727 TaxID=2925845 RepID=UPI001F531AF0|nr:hypothetical protein [Paenibacillus sp. N3/727]UNK19450.1 hypothetical protein MNQ98_05295 [Paenibacillus sp. N3/727]